MKKFLTLVALSTATLSCVYAGPPLTTPGFLYSRENSLQSVPPLGEVIFTTLNVNNNIVPIPSGAGQFFQAQIDGKYIVAFSVRPDQFGDGTENAFEMRVNGTAIAGPLFRNRVSTASGLGNPPPITGAATVQLAVGDVVSVNNSSGTTTVGVQTARIDITRVGIGAND